MTNYVFDAPPQASAEIVGTEDRFPIRRIFCVGRNYRAHAYEMGKDPDRDPPFFFSKPADAYVATGESVAYPSETEDFHHEAELVIAIGKAGKNIPEDAALDHIWGYAVGNDLTRRDLQNDAKETGRPWDWAKGFDRSACMAPIHPVSEVGHLSQGPVRLTVNDEVRQDADLKELIWSVPEIIEYLTRSMELRPGDLIYTGTPAGVGPLVPGDVCTVEIEGLSPLTTTITERE